MKAEIGDFLVVKGSAAKHHDHRALITEVRSADGSPPYVVRWLDDDRVATVFPGPDAIVVTAQEQREADDRQLFRIERVQHGIARSAGNHDHRRR